MNLEKFLEKRYAKLVFTLCICAGLIILHILFILPSDEEIKKYVETNIGYLSPEKATLSGTFYVTQVKLLNNIDRHGIVEYEDGHSAYVADFHTELGLFGNVVIKDFTIRH